LTGSIYNNREKGDENLSIGATVELGIKPFGYTVKDGIAKNWEFLASYAYLNDLIDSNQDNSKL
jgi:hypothetical protein